MLYNAAFESELLLEGHILLWTLNELGGRLLNFHEDFFAFITICTNKFKIHDRNASAPHLQGRPAGVYYRMHLRSGTDIPA